MMRFLFFLLFTSCLAFQSEAKLTVKTYGGINNIDRRFDYMLGLLNLALEKTRNTHGDFEVKLQPGVDQEDRLKSLRQRKIDLVIHPIIEKDIENLIPIRFPLRQGLLGYRVLLIRKEDQGRFSKIKSLSDLLKMKMAFSPNWVDIKIYRDAGFNVQTAEDYNDIFRLLETKQVDFVPRGVVEVKDELKMRAGFLKNLAVEESVLIYYPLDEYFYVRPGGEKIAERVKAGLEKSLADGSYQKYFDGFYAQTIKDLHLKKRKLIQLNNNLIPKDTPMNDAKYWRHPEALLQKY